MKRHNLRHHFSPPSAPLSDMSYYPVYSLPEDTCYEWCRANAIADGPHPTMDRSMISVANNTSVQAWNAFDVTPLGETTGADQLYGAFAATKFSSAADSQTPSPSLNAHNDTQYNSSLEASPPGLSPIFVPSRDHASPSPDTTHNLSDKSFPRRRLARSRLSRAPLMSPTSRRETCLPHKQVERKYREGLNMSFERLRRAVPTLPRSVDSDVMGSAKPSKGMVLAAAIEYIKMVERERDAALSSLQKREENMRVLNM